MRYYSTDYGKEPLVINLEEATENNNYFRRALWTGKHLQVTLMSIPVRGEIGLEIHPDHDQFLRIEDGLGEVAIGTSEHNLTFRKLVKEDDAIFIPAGAWHNLVNIGSKPLKLYSIYAPVAHPAGIIEPARQFPRYY